MITGLENVADIFNIFHDGSMRRTSLQDGNLHFLIDIEYLAEVIVPTYQYFHFSLYDVKNCVFTAWIGAEFKPISVEQFAELEPEILSSKVTVDTIEVICYSHQRHRTNSQISSEICYLKFNGEKARVQDQGGRELSLEALIALANESIA